MMLPQGWGFQTLVWVDGFPNSWKLLKDSYQWCRLSERLLRSYWGERSSWPSESENSLDAHAWRVLWHKTENIQGNNPAFLEFSKRVATEAFHFIVPVVTSGADHGQSVSVRRTRDQVASTYTYTTEDHDNDNNSSQAMWAMFQQRHEHSFSTGDLRKIKMNIQEGKEDEALTVGKQIYIGRINCCRGYVEKLGNSGTVTAGQKANLRAIHMATKSRPMKSLRNCQKRKYGTPPTIISQHASRRELVIAPMRDWIFVSNAEQPERENYHSDDGPINDGALCATDLVFEIGEVLVFRGIDGLPFNLLKITGWNLARWREHFLCHGPQLDRCFNGIRTYCGTAMTVCLDETVTITETTYKMSVETYNEIQEIAEEFEDPLRRALLPLHADDNYEDDDKEATLEQVEAEETLAYQNRRQRRGRASRYNDINKTTHISCLKM